MAKANLGFFLITPPLKAGLNQLTILALALK
jgi:hypothetical protein